MWNSLHTRTTRTTLAGLAVLVLAALPCAGGEAPVAKRGAAPAAPSPSAAPAASSSSSAASSAALSPAAVPPASMAPTPAAAAESLRWVILIRHGDYTRVADADDRTANGLNALGHEQARAAGERLASLPAPVGRFVCSDYTRARDTAADIGGILGRTAEVDSLLHECTPRAARADYMQNHSPQEIAACDSALAQAWRKYFVPSPAKESRDVLVCHGNVIRWFVCRALGVDTARWSSLDIGNASMTVIQVRPDGSTRLAAFSDVGHLPPGRQSFTGRGAGWLAPRTP